MTTVLKNSWALMLGMLLLMLGNGLQGTLLGVRGAIENFDSNWMGLIMSAYFIGFLGGSKMTPMLLKRVGHVRVFAALGSLVSAAFILYAAIVDPWLWLFLRLVVGFCFSGIYVVAESWLNESNGNETRGQALSLYLMVQMAGIVLGQLLLNVADPAGYELFVLITVLVSISFAPILLSSSPAPMFQTTRAMSLSELITTSPLACWGNFLLGGIFAVLFAMAPVYATKIGLGIKEISYFITAIYAGGMIFQYPIGWLSDRMDRRLLIIIVTGLGTATALVAFLNNNASMLYLIAFLLGGFSNPLYSLLIAYANDYLDSDQMPAASGGMLFINGIGAMSGPVSVGLIMDTFGTEYFFAYISVLMAAICSYGIFRSFQRSAISVDDASPYIPLTSRSTQVAAEIAIEIVEEEANEEDNTPIADR